MDDLISRQAALDAIFSEPLYKSGMKKRDADVVVPVIYEKIKSLPSAQPEKVDTPTVDTPTCADAVSRKAAIDIVQGYAEQLHGYIGMPNDSEVYAYARGLLLSIDRNIKALPSAQPETHDKRTETHACDLISRQAAIDAILAVTGNSSVRELYEHVQEHGLSDMWSGGVNAAIDIIIAVPSAQPERLACGEGELITQPEIVRCKDCEHGEQDEVGRWFCRSLGCQIGNEDGSGYCADAERRTDGTDAYSDIG